MRAISRRSGAPEEVYDRPVSPFVASFMGADNTIELEVAARRRRRRGEGGRGAAPSAGAAPTWPGRSPPISATTSRGSTPRTPRRAARSCCPGRIAQRTYPGGALSLRGRDRRASLHRHRRTATSRSKRRSACACRCDSLHLFPKRPRTREDTMRRASLAAALGRRLLRRAGERADTLNVATAGDQNMVDYVKDYLGPLFEKEHPGVKVRGGRHRPGRRRLAEDLREARRAEEGRHRRHGTSTWSSSTRRSPARWCRKACSTKYRDKIPTGNAGDARTRLELARRGRLAATSCRCSTRRRRSPTTPTW